MDIDLRGDFGELALRVLSRWRAVRHSGMKENGWERCSGQKACSTVLAKLASCTEDGYKNRYLKGVVSRAKIK